MHLEAVEIGVLWYPGAQAAAVLGFVDLLKTARRLNSERASTGPGLNVRLFRAEEPGKTPDSPETPLAALILPPSLEGVDVASLGPLAAWIAERRRQGTILCSVCAGAFLLAATGLLAGRKATTHWALHARFAESFPDVLLDSQKMLIDEGDIVTAGGMMAWIDLALTLVGRFLGPSVMLSTARRWVVDPGGREQRFYGCFTPFLTHGDDAILRVQHWLSPACAERIDLAAMAHKARLGQRTFMRRFQKATGYTPLEYLQLLRVERARDLLELSVLSFDEIAWKLGYSDPGAFRRVFLRVMGLTPGEYRRRFGVGKQERPEAPHDRS